MKDNGKEALLRTVGERLGMSPQELQEKLMSGELEGVIKNMGSDGDKFRAVMSDRSKMEKIMQSPQAQALIKKLGG